jgi:hypothetical protein
VHKRIIVLVAVVSAAGAFAAVPATSQQPSHVLADDTLAALVASGGAESGGPESAGDPVVHVEVLHHTDPATIAHLVAEAGGTITGEVPGVLVEGDLPLSSLADLEATDEVDFIRTPESVSEPLAEEPVPVAESASPELGFDSQEVAATRADTWHVAGITGEGVRVGIIDAFSDAAWRVARRNGEVPSEPAATFCRIEGASCDVWGDDTAHGVAVTEIIMDMAPHAQLYLARVETTADLQAAIDWFATMDVQVVNRSLTSPFDGPGDGTGPIAEVIDNAVTAGMTFVQAGGNAGGRRTPRPVRPGSYFRWTFADADHDGWVEFAPGDERLTVDCGFLNGLRWDDFDEGGDTTDYDLYVYNGAGTVLKGSSTDDQALGAPPIERVEDCTTPTAQLAVKLVAERRRARAVEQPAQRRGAWRGHGQLRRADGRRPHLLQLARPDQRRSHQAGPGGPDLPGERGHHAPVLRGHQRLGSRRRRSGRPAAAASAGLDPRGGRGLDPDVGDQ